VTRVSVPASISEDRHLLWFTKNLAKDFDWLDWPSLVCRLQSTKTEVARVSGVNSATCYTSVKLKFGVAWAQKDPAKITTSTPVKVWDFGRT
jgi:hypothetical protein